MVSKEGLLTQHEAAAYLQIAPGTLKHWALAKKIEYVKVGTFMRFTREALERFIASQTIAIMSFSFLISL
jgi:excisionase family DNA binding protein